MKIKHISPASAGKTLGVAAGFFGLVIGVVYSLGHLLFGGPRYGYGSRSLWDEILSSPFAFVLAPLFWFVIAFVIGFVLAVAYNVAAGLSGGLDVDLEGEDPLGQKGKEFDW